MLVGEQISKDHTSFYIQVGKVLSTKNGTSILAKIHATIVNKLWAEEMESRCTDAMAIDDLFR